MPVRMEGDRKHNTAYKLTFADFIHGESPQAIRTTFNLELGRHPALYIRIPAIVSVLEFCRVLFLCRIFALQESVVVTLAHRAVALPAPSAAQAVLLAVAAHLTIQTLATSQKRSDNLASDVHRWCYSGNYICSGHFLRHRYSPDY